MKDDLRNPGNLPENNILDARLGGGRHGDSVPITSQTGSNPKNIEFRDGTLSSAANFGLRHFRFLLESTPELRSDSSLTNRTEEEFWIGGCADNVPR
jgi:hypothetical protein